MNTQDLLNKAQKYDTISFDVFGTLLVRDVIKPTEVFELAHGKFFRYRRIAAEVFAHKAAGKREEITLEEIYRFLPGVGPEEELRCEKKVCRANPAVKEVYDTLKGQGKRIFAISDMYLPGEFIRELLEENGIYVEEVFVSSDYGVCKRSGRLFEVFCDKKNIEPGSFLHIGDDKRSDIEGAKRAGVESLLVAGDTDKILYMKHKGNDPLLRGYINHRLNGIDDRCERLGYEILGPIFVSFCQWLHEKKMEYGYDKLFFLARDMYLPMEIYRELYGGEDIRYLRISRKSLTNASNHRQNIIEYLKKSGCYGNVAIVDTGWRGVMQIIIGHYAKQIEPAAEIGGLYMGKYLIFDKLNIAGKNGNCFCESKKMQRKAIIYTTLLEALVGKSEPKAIDYDENGEPVYEDKLPSVKGIARLQEGALEFANDWKQEGNREIEPNAVFRNFCRLCDRPLEEDIEGLGLAEFDDIEVSNLVRYRGWKHYLRHPGDWFTDLRLSAWKGAFFKKSFPHMRVFYAAYFWLDSYALSYADWKKLYGKSVEELMEYYQ